MSLIDNQSPKISMDRARGIFTEISEHKLTLGDGILISNTQGPKISAIPLQYNESAYS